MSCGLKIQDIDLSCIEPTYRMSQQVVLFEKSDVESFEYRTPAYGYNEYSLSFTPKTGVLGTGIQFKVDSNNLKVNSSKTIVNGVAQYTHNVSIIALSEGEQDLINLEYLDNGKYFAAITDANGVPKVYGFENGLVTQNYSLDTFDNKGVVYLDLVTPSGLYEDTLPLIWNI